jgi:uncharacterized protein (DUF2062 family)
VKKLFALISAQCRRLVDYVRSLCRRLLELRDTPHAIAGGVAIGVFYGFTPLFGAKTLLSLATAWLARCSKIAAVISVSLHDVVTPLWPFLLRLEYVIGYWTISHPHRLPPKLALHHVKLVEMFQWTNFHKVGLPLLVGSIIIAIPAALVAYSISYWFMHRRQLRQLRPSA